jgi:hypothetical protein
VVIGTHTHLAVGTQVLGSIPSLPDMATRVQSSTNPHDVMGWDGTTPMRGLCTSACQPQSVGRCSQQATPSTSAPMRESLAAKQREVRWWPPQEPSQTSATSTPGSQEDDSATFSKLYKPTFPAWGPTRHVT